jgi:hypothetical protein
MGVVMEAVLTEAHVDLGLCAERRSHLVPDDGDVWLRFFPPLFFFFFFDATTHHTPDH